MDSEADAAAAPAAAAAASATVKRVKVKKTDVPVTAAGVPGPATAEVARLAQAEGEMQAADKLQEDTQVWGRLGWAGGVCSVWFRTGVLGWGGVGVLGLGCPVKHQHQPHPPQTQFIPLPAAPQNNQSKPNQTKPNSSHN
jgi:hypothetical protein